MSNISDLSQQQPSPHELAISQDLAVMEAMRDLQRRSTDSDMSRPPLQAKSDSSRKRSLTCTDTTRSSPTQSFNLILHPVKYKTPFQHFLRTYPEPISPYLTPHLASEARWSPLRGACTRERFPFRSRETYSPIIAQLIWLNASFPEFDFVHFRETLGDVYAWMYNMREVHFALVAKVEREMEFRRVLEEQNRRRDDEVVMVGARYHGDKARELLGEWEKRSVPDLKDLMAISMKVSLR